MAIQGKDGRIKNLQTISEDLLSYVPVSSLENLAHKGTLTMRRRRRKKMRRNWEEVS